MDRTYWLRQTDTPLFPDLVWSRPEHRSGAGKLLIVGGNAHGFAAPAEAYNQSVQAGVGIVRALMPDAIQRVVKSLFETADFAPSTPSGSFSKESLSEFLAHAHWADSVLLAGDLGRNSETAIVLELFAQKYSGQLVITKDALDYFTSSPSLILSRQETTLVLSFAQLQKIAIHIKHEEALKFDMDFVRIIDWLHKFSKRYTCNLVVKHVESIFVAVNGRVSTTKTPADLEKLWRIPTAAAIAVWWLQNPTKPFEALTTALFKAID